MQAVRCKPMSTDMCAHWGINPVQKRPGVQQVKRFLAL
jgi:copper chaperone CopZ